MPFNHKIRGSTDFFFPTCTIHTSPFDRGRPLIRSLTFFVRSFLTRSRRNNEASTLERQNTRRGVVHARSSRRYSWCGMMTQIPGGGKTKKNKNKNRNRNKKRQTDELLFSKGCDETGCEFKACCEKAVKVEKWTETLPCDVLLLLRRRRRRRPHGSDTS